MLYKHASDVKWIPYNKLHVGKYMRVHHDTMSDVVVLKHEVGSEENTYTRAIQCMWLSNQLILKKVHDKENRAPLYANLAGIPHRSLKGLNPKINPDQPP